MNKGVMVVSQWQREILAKLVEEKRAHRSEEDEARIQERRERYRERPIKYVGCFLCKRAGGTLRKFPGNRYFHKACYLKARKEHPPYERVSE